MLSGASAAQLLAEWPPGKRQQLLSSCQLCAPTECCVVEVSIAAWPLWGMHMLFLLAILDAWLSQVSAWPAAASSPHR